MIIEIVNNYIVLFLQYIFYVLLSNHGNFIR